MEGGRLVRGYCNGQSRKNELGSERANRNKKITVRDKADYIARTEWRPGPGEKRSHRGLGAFAGWL